MVARVVTVVDAVIVVVNFPVGGNGGEQVNVPRLHKLFVPLLPHFRNRFGPRFFRCVVVNVVACADEEVWF